LAPNSVLPTYPPADSCIYCGSKVYSDLPHIRRLPLGEEHIVAEGLGGRLKLKNASCKDCEDITGGLVEDDVLGETLKALRVHWGIRGKRRPIPKTLPLTVHRDGRETVEEVEIADYPVIFYMPVCGPPPIISRGAASLPPIVGMQLVLLNRNDKLLRDKYGITQFSTVRWDTVMLCRMLAKIGHSLAMAELGRGLFKPMLLDLILRDHRDSIRLIGGDPELSEPSNALHELGLGYLRVSGNDYVVATIRLFAHQGGPTYYVVVGESLESRIVKFKRVFSKRISSIVSR
jgi:hypothetical protein